MTVPPPNPKIYHITHVGNLPRIVADGCLVSDREMIERGGPEQAIGMWAIKRRRVTELGVDPHPGTRVGDYVPFYFCPRSIMLYVIARRNHTKLTYRGGQDPIVHLEADLEEVIAWAEEHGRPWAFSLSNAGAYYTEFRSRREDLDQLDWPSIAATDFRGPGVRAAKQAEFLLHGRFPISLVRRVGVRTPGVQAQAQAALQAMGSAPPVAVLPRWYY